MLEDIDVPVLSLCSDVLSDMTGRTLIVDGDHTAK